MIRLFFSLLLLLPLIVSSLQLYQAVSEPFPYQAHSFNDLNIARRFLLKKVKYFKFDASLASRESCQKYSSWNNNNSCIKTSQYAEEVCCLAMRGDASSEPNFYYPFNTSKEFTTMLNQFLSTYESEIDILFIAIDFQFGFQFTNLLAEQFMADLATLMYKFSKLHVTTKGDYILQYDQACRYFQTPTEAALNLVLQHATNEYKSSSNCNEVRNFISKSRFFLQSSSSATPYDSRDYKGRFQNFNIIYKEIDRLCRDGFPTWMNKYPSFPIIFWEPSNERQIQSALDKLMSPQCAKKHNRTLQGIALASNIDPEMFEFFLKKTRPSAYTLQFPWSLSQSKLWLQNATAVKMAKIVDSSNAEKLVVYQKKQNFNQIQHFVSILAMAKDQKTVQIEKEVQIHEQVVELRTVKDRIVLVTRKSPQALKQFDAVLIAFNSQLSPTAMLPIDNFITCSSNGQSLYYIVLSSNPSVFITYQVDSTLMNPKQYKLPVQLSSSQIQSITSMIFLTSGQNDVQLLTGDNGNQTWLAKISDSQEHKIKNLAFGTNSRIVETETNRITILLENSYTHGGLLINNNGENVCLYHQIDHLKPLATVPYLINGVQSSIDDLLAFLESDSEDIITACNRKISFAKYLNGEDSEAVSIWNRLLISTKFVPIHQQSLISTLFSGGSNFDSAFRSKQGYLITASSSRTQKTSKVFFPSFQNLVRQQ